MLKRLIRTIFILALTAISAKAVSLYQIGNSLTQDSSPQGIAAVAASAGIDLANGFHVRSSSSLGQIWDDPGGYTVVDGTFGSFASALPSNAWDHITLQATDNGSETLGDDLIDISRFVDLAEQHPGNDDTQFYLYGPWPWTIRYGGWDREVPNELSEPSWNRRENYQNLIDRLEEISPGKFRLIPVGEVFSTISDRLDGEAFNGETRIGHLYRDVIHLNPLGSFVSATTFVATMFKVNPIGLPVPREVQGWNETRLPDDLAREIQEVIWEVVVDEKRTGVSPVGDINVDTRVDENDREIWRQAFSFQTTLTADSNGDGIVDQVDRDQWFDALDPDTADIDGDGAATQSDLQLWQAAFGTVGSTPADTNGDGTVDAADYTVWRDAKGLFEATDFNHDGLVDEQDLAIWNSELGWAEDQPADLNQNGVVDAADYTLWRDNQNSSIFVTTIPEPTANLLLVLATGYLVVACRLRGVIRG